MFRRYTSIRCALDACDDHRQVIVLDGEPCVVVDTVVRQLQIDGATVSSIDFDGREITRVRVNVK